jgi:Cof subfamily protein (haloacid dehalogenase superfamily)
MIRLLALDLDGTLMDDRMVIKSSRVRRAITAAQQRGVVVTLATGRMLAFTVPFARELGIVAPLICYQGGLIQAPDSDVPLYHATMEPALMREVLEWRDGRDWQFVLYAGHDIFLDKRRHPQSFYHGCTIDVRDMLGEHAIWVDDLSSVITGEERHEPIKFVIIVEPHEADLVQQDLQQQFGDRLEVTRSHAIIIEGNPSGVSKGDALRRLAAHLGVPQAQVMAIGDQDNDISMVRWAGLGVAMGNGSQAAKAAADWIAPPVAEDGAAVAIERFVLNAS